MNRTEAEKAAREITELIDGWESNEPQMADIIERAGGENRKCPECGSEKRRRWNIANCTCPKASKKNPDPRHLATCYCQNKCHSEAEKCVGGQDAEPIWLVKDVAEYKSLTEIPAAREVAATAYQICGTLEAPARILDYFSAVASGEAAENPLPFTPERSCGETAWVSASDPLEMSRKQTIDELEVVWAIVADLRQALYNIKSKTKEMDIAMMAETTLLETRRR